MFAKKSVLINPLVARGVDDPHRVATPLELFYDLIYVVAIASLAGQLHHAITDWHHVGSALWMYVFIFWAIWWSWNTYTWFASGYDTDDAQFRLASFAQMIGVIVMAVGAEKAFKDNDFLLMMVGYVIMRIPYILMWLKVAYDDPKSRPTALFYAVGVTLVQVGWTVSVLFFPSWLVFITLLVLELVVPYLAESAVDKGRNTTYHFHHIEERLGLLTIIVLGESILAAVSASGQAMEHLSLPFLLEVFGFMMILFSMWWLYFDDQLGHELASQRKAFLWAYGHYFVYAAATAVGALISVNVDVLTHHAKISHEAAVIGLALAIAGYLAAVWLVHDFLISSKTRIRRYELLILAVVVLAIALLTANVLLIGIAFAALNATRLYRRHQQFRADAQRA